MPLNGSYIGTLWFAFEAKSVYKFSRSLRSRKYCQTFKKELKLQV